VISKTTLALSGHVTFYSKLYHKRNITLLTAQKCKPISWENCSVKILLSVWHSVCDNWDLVTTGWLVLRLRMQERPPIWRAAVDILNKQSRTADKWWSFGLEVGPGVHNSSPSKLALLRNMYTCFELELIHWYDLSKKKK